MSSPKMQPHLKGSDDPKFKAAGGEGDAAAEEFRKSFPNGYEIISNSIETEQYPGTIHALVDSMEAQFSDERCPTRKELNDILLSQVFKKSQGEGFDPRNIDRVESAPHLFNLLNAWCEAYGVEKKFQLSIVLGNPNNAKHPTGTPTAVKEGASGNGESSLGSFHNTTLPLRTAVPSHQATPESLPKDSSMGLDGDSRSAEMTVEHTALVAEIKLLGQKVTEMNHVCAQNGQLLEELTQQVALGQKLLQRALGISPNEATPEE